MDEEKLLKEISQRALTLNDKNNLSPLIDKIKDRRVVMLGESSHGTQEYYEWRYLISRELVENHGFNFIAVEGDWPACQKVNEFVHSQHSSSSAFDILKNFSRWPTWMWANAEMIELVEWMKTAKVSFHGLDVYSFFESIEEVIRLLKDVDPLLARDAVKYYTCFHSFNEDEKKYARSLFHFPEGCREEVLRMLQALLEYRLKAPAEVSDALFDATQNARIVRNAERYYRAMLFGQEDSWNVRDEHMLETLDTLLNHYGPHSKGIVWAHNSHIGDYNATDMVLSSHVNLGGLAREKYGQAEVALVGFGTHHGQVIASHAWDGPTQVMKVPPAAAGSLEDSLHEVAIKMGMQNFMLIFDKSSRESVLAEYKRHRAIGVVYLSDWESKGNYVPTSVANRYDAFIYFDETHALTPLNLGFNPYKLPETYPFARQ